MYYLTAIATSASAGVLTYVAVRLARQLKAAKTEDTGQR